MTPWTAACQASLSLTMFLSLPKFMPIESVLLSNHLSLTMFLSLPKFMPIESVLLSNHLILCCPFLLLLWIFPRIRDFSNRNEKPEINPYAYGQLIFHKCVKSIKWEEGPCPVAECCSLSGEWNSMFLDLKAWIDHQARVLGFMMKERILEPDKEKLREEETGLKIQRGDWFKMTG